MLNKIGILPQPPASIEKYTPQIQYISPAAEAQVSSKSVNLQRFIQDVVPLLNVDPTLADTIDFGDVARQFSDYRRVSKSAIRPKEEVDAMRKQRAEAEQQQQQSETMSSAASSLKDVATAQEKGMNLF
jgi:hypothetical protein